MTIDDVNLSESGLGILLARGFGSLNGFRLKSMLTAPLLKALNEAYLHLHTKYSCLLVFH